MPDPDRHSSPACSEFDLLTHKITLLALSDDSCMHTCTTTRILFLASFLGSGGLFVLRPRSFLRGAAN